MNIQQLKQNFKTKLNKMTDKELQSFDEWYIELQDHLIDKFNDLKRPRLQRALDYVYMYFIATDKREYDERYDNCILHDAVIFSQLKYKKQLES